MFVRKTSCYKYHYHAAKLRDFTAKADKILAAPPSSPAVRPPPRVGGVFYPIGYGADPTGHNDSADAIQSALNDAFEQLSDPSQELMPGIKDLGGAVIDLQGGKYKIGKPISFPPVGGGDILIKEGSLRAAEGFPSDRFLVELLFPQSEILINKTENVSLLQGTTIFYEDITFRDLLFDSGHSGGGLLVVDTARVRILNSYFFNFTTQGILVQGGHETFIQTCFIGQHPTVGGGVGEKDYSGTAIDLAGNDNVVTDAVIFSSAIGVVLRGQANMLRNIHTYNKERIFGGIGILVRAFADYNRITDCFVDYNSIVLEDPRFIQITNSFFLGYANVVLKAVKGRLEALSITDNFFRGIDMAPVVELQGEFTEVRDVAVERNQAWNSTVKSTSAKTVLARKGTKWVADFSKVLLFPDKIEYFQYSFLVKESSRMPIHAATAVAGNKVVVESEGVADAVVSVVVDQCNPI
ncbi:unnamed protein product [Linum tenue]|uniref:Pectate lyase superfamily protein domain-containing protein n=1 Tax=Linum tenue TaxID=586396 RepID=A0AAV0GS17_9ROSI|nr:unnamed protein product [Linum tenue]